MGALVGLRQLEKSWDYWTIAGAITVSFLGAFTSTQLMIQARLSTRFSSVLMWLVLISLTFGFCASWSLHFVSTLACKLDLPIGLDVGLTIFSALLAVMFTFIAIGVDLVRGSYRSNVRSKGHPLLGVEAPQRESANTMSQESLMPLLARDSVDDGLPQELLNGEGIAESYPKAPLHQRESRAGAGASNHSSRDLDALISGMEVEQAGSAYDSRLSSTVVQYTPSESRNSSSNRAQLGDLQSMAFQGSMLNKNAFVANFEGVYAGMSWTAIMMGLVWSLSLTSMHYVGLFALRIPGGYVTLNSTLVLISAIISWLVCIVGYIYMVHIEPHLSQQILFSTVTAIGVAAMHFTGMRATTFWSRNPPADARGYPPELPIAVCSVAILTCMLANGLLAHDATVSRNKLAEIVWTRRKLWRAIAQKENAEAAVAARNTFIASASHEIRTPLHHLQGYSDLLSQTELTEEGRQLLLSIQRATKTLSLITNNVLDWSKLESDRDALCRPISLDMRTVAESILVLLPNHGDENDVEVMIVISPDVPDTLILDETYIHRVLMNLMSNSLKFTKSGYIMLILEMSGSDLVAKVRDTGTGVPPTFLDQLFEPFSQARTQGSQRGTGLGLSIVKQLLRKLEATITVESRHTDQGFRQDETGTTFTVTIPTNSTHSPPFNAQPVLEPGIVALLCPVDSRVLDGLKIAWETFGCEVIVVEHLAELSNLQIRYVWATSRILEHYPDWLHHLISQDRPWTVLVPFDNQESLQGLYGVLSTPNFIPLHKPLIWHTIASSIVIASQALANADSSRQVRFASKRLAADEGSLSLLDGSMNTKKVNILLVEDNLINQKLGEKMLKSLGYSVLLASDGDEAIAQVLKYDTAIDMILMDQSMPIKDGVTATREIRALESTARLSRRHHILALTAVVGAESRAQFKDAGADDFLAKPLSIGKLEQTLATFLLVK